MTQNLEKKSISEARKIELIEFMTLKIKQKLYVQKAFGAWKNWLKSRKQVKKVSYFFNFLLVEGGGEIMHF